MERLLEQASGLEREGEPANAGLGGEMNLEAIPWLEILGVGGLAGVVSALFTGAIREYFRWRDRKRHARYLALRLSLILEDYYHRCVAAVYDIHNYQSSSGYLGDDISGLPPVPEYPADGEAWVYLAPGIADEILSLPARVQETNAGISFIRQLSEATPDDTLEPLYDMAFMAIDLARRVRVAHKLPSASRTQDSEARLREDHSRFQSRLEAYHERQEAAGLSV